MDKELREIYTLLSSLNVNGDAVDIMAIVRGKLRKLMEDCKNGE